jgi:hypothetical protein
MKIVPNMGFFSGRERVNNRYSPVFVLFLHNLSQNAVNTSLPLKYRKYLKIPLYFYPFERLKDIYNLPTYFSLGS